MNFLTTFHSNRASELDFINKGVLGTLEREYERGMWTQEEFYSLVDEHKVIESQMLQAYDAHCDSVGQYLAHLSFCQVRSRNKAHAQHLERLRAHTPFEVDPTCIELLLRDSVQAHAPPCKNLGTDRVTPKPSLAHTHRSTLRGPSG